MTLRIRHLRLRAETSSGPFGADISFSTGLNVLWADNTKGKSTSLQGLLYALGLERMLSPRREIPLTYVMTSHLEEDDKTYVKHSILGSSVSVELENAAGRVITVRRAVKSAGDTRLVTVFQGPQLTNQTGQYEQRDYFVLDPGAAQREAGFHRYLAEFMGWQLPRARRFDGSETMLYLETVFPLLYVEQKAGWSSLPAAFPNYLQIRDVGRRAIEFLMGLATHDLELRRQKLDMDIAASNSTWAAKRAEILSVATVANARIQGIPTTPTISVTDIESAFLQAPTGDEWRPLEDIMSALRQRVADLRGAEVPDVEDMSAAAAEELSQVMVTAAEQNTNRNTLFRARQVEIIQRASVQRRIAALEEDLQKNQDAQKLRNFGSKLTEAFAADHCPTCSQPIQDTLLAQQASAAVMPVEDNIEYIKSQRAIFQRLNAQVEASIAGIERRLAAATVEVNETNSRLRALRADLIAPSHSPSTATLEERLRAEVRLDTLEDVQQRFEQHKVALVALAAHHAQLLAERQTLPADRLTVEDQAKLNRMTRLIQEQAASYGFTTFPASEIEIAPDNFRPQKEGFEIGFELSASDAIRLKWAYHLALMELSRTDTTNHPGFVVFDEPRQQAAREVSFQRLLERAATAKAAGQQVIFATSEDRGRLEGFLEGIDCNYRAFDGYIVKPLAS
jgi:hypothetical protein